MKTISLWQPWASAIALGLKKVETRSWSTSYRGTLAIHAAKTKEHLDYIRDPSVWPAFVEVGIKTTEDLPLGSVVAICRLVDVVPVEKIRCVLSPLELALGGYEDKRFGWMLEDVQKLATPVPFRGAQMFFEVPDKLLIDALLIP